MRLARSVGGLMTLYDVWQDVPALWRATVYVVLALAMINHIRKAQ